MYEKFFIKTIREWLFSKNCKCNYVLQLTRTVYLEIAGLSK